MVIRIFAKIAVGLYLLISGIKMLKDYGDNSGAYLFIGLGVFVLALSLFAAYLYKKASSN